MNSTTDVDSIVNALAAGLAAGLTTTASAAVKDLYAGLRDAVRRRLSRDAGEAGTAALDAYLKDPKGARQPLADALRSVQAENDRELVAGAQRLLAVVSKTSSASKYSISMPDAKAVQIGDGNRQDITFK